MNQQLATLNSGQLAQPRVDNHNEEIFALQERNKILASQLTEKGGSDPDIEAKMADNTRKIFAPPQFCSQRAQQQRPNGREKKEDLQNQKFKLDADINACKENITLITSRVKEADQIAFRGRK